MKINRSAILFILVSIFIMSCQDEYNVLEDKKPLMPQELLTNRVFIDEVKNVAFVYNNKVATRSIKVIGDISTINNSSGEPVIFVVNFENQQGFLLISATKNYYPILAHSDRGEFITNGFMPDGLSDWIRDTQVSIETADKLPTDSTRLYRSMWQQYILQKNEVKTRASDEELNDYITACRHRWEAEGHTYNSLGGAYDWLPSDVYERFCAAAEASVFPIYDYMESFIVRKEYSFPDNMENFINVTWDQRSGYNAAYDKINGELPPAGCVPVAVAQVLRYYKHPSFFDWNSMPTNYATSQTAALMKNIAMAVHAVPSLEGTSASLQNARNALVSNYGYSSKAQLVNHKVGSLRGQLKNKQPVIMQGFSQDGKEGHAWICSGYNAATGYVEYELHVLISELYMSSIDSYRENDFSYERLYMNWGWGGSYNGYYSDNNVYNPVGSFNRNRKDIINVSPN